MNSLKKFRNLMLSNTGRFIESAELDVLFGKIAWQSDLRLLVEYEGYDIVVAPALTEPGPHLIFLKSDRQLFSFSDQIPIRTRQAIAKRGDLTCKSCGRAQGDADPTTTGRRLRLFVSQLVDPVKWSAPTFKNIEVLCTACREGVQGLQIDRPSARKLKVHARRANGVDQLDLLNWLVNKYPDQARQYLRSRKFQA